MAGDALGAEGDGRERVLDLVRHLLCNFLPRQLPLRAKELRGVFDDQDRACLLAAEIEPRAGDSQVQGSAAAGLRPQPTRRPYDWRGGSPRRIFRALGRQQRLDALAGQRSVLLRPIRAAKARLACTPGPRCPA